MVDRNTGLYQTLFVALFGAPAEPQKLLLETNDGVRFRFRFLSLSSKGVGG